ncbi:hypothetical protein [Anaeromyxobacter sp. Fw109-5]|uniref:hypothetical protein n=1 Tax=Anaeromyxobacter sp. (strain Fw109-5) TaxID=404589 RepID=UPI000158A525|nr:hypothetical protein [Anaeromyxobacter sp. Fw109-5]ABS25324.1 hypothetical protein Anae109_1116 [Anaeromyxobacter sp. Fw109-5]
MLAHRLTCLSRLALVGAVLVAGCSERAPSAAARDDQGDPPGAVGGGELGGGVGGDTGDGVGDDSGGDGDGGGDDGGGGGDDDGGGGDDGGGSVLRVGIDVKPGTAGAAPIQLGAGGKVPVAILGAPAFDVTAIELTSIRFAGAPLARRGRAGPMAALEDVDGDGREDLVCHFEVAELELSGTATVAGLEGSTGDGARFAGEDAIRTVP